MEENPPQVQAATGLIVSVKADGTVTIEGEDSAVGGGGGEPHAGNAVSPIRAFTRRLLELEMRYNLAAEPLPDACASDAGDDAPTGSPATDEVDEAKETL